MSENRAPFPPVEQLCEIAHDAYEAAAVIAGWETNKASRVPWAEVPDANKATMRAAMGAVWTYVCDTSLRASREEAEQLRAELHRQGEDANDELTSCERERDLLAAENAELRAERDGLCGSLDSTAMRLVRLVDAAGGTPNSDDGEGMEAHVKQALVSTRTPVPLKCNDLCLTAADVDVHVPGNPVAHAHMSCPLHGDPAEMGRRADELLDEWRERAEQAEAALVAERAKTAAVEHAINDDRIRDVNRSSEWRDAARAIAAQVRLVLVASPAALSSPEPKEPTT